MSRRRSVISVPQIGHSRSSRGLFRQYPAEVLQAFEQYRRWPGLTCFGVNSVPQ